MHSLKFGAALAAVVLGGTNSSASAAAILGGSTRSASFSYSWGATNASDSASNIDYDSINFASGQTVNVGPTLGAAYRLTGNYAAGNTFGGPFTGISYTQVVDSEARVDTSGGAVGGTPKASSQYVWASTFTIDEPMNWTATGNLLGQVFGTGTNSFTIGVKSTDDAIDQTMTFSGNFSWFAGWGGQLTDTSKTYVFVLSSSAQCDNTGTAAWSLAYTNLNPGQFALTPVPEPTAIMLSAPVLYLLHRRRTPREHQA